MKTIKAARIQDNAILPTRKHPDDAGIDFYAAEEKVIPPHGMDVVGTGITVEIPQGYVGLVYARSGIACKRGLAPANKVGVIDSDYRGEILVALHNHSAETQRIERGERIAQLVLARHEVIEWEEAAELAESGRGAGGFGSTGTK